MNGRPTRRLGRLGGVWAGSIVAALALASAIAVKVIALDTDAPAYAATPNVYDLMARTVASGFGSADQGGRYESWPAPTSTAGGASLSVSGGAGHIDGVAPGQSAGATLPAISNADEQVQLAFTVAQLPSSGNGEYVRVLLRQQANGDGYLARVMINPAGRLILGISQVRSGVEYHLGGDAAAPQQVRAGQQVMLEGLVAGSSTIDLRVRAWLAGAQQPDWLLRRTDTASTRLTRAGAVGMSVYTSASSPTSSLRLANLAGWALRPVSGPNRSVVLPTQSSSPSAPASTAVPSTAALTGAAPADAVPTSAAPATDTSSAPSTATPSPSSTGLLAPAPGRGAAAVGSTSYPVPAGALFVSSAAGKDSASGTQASPLATVAAAVSRAASGQAIVLRAGLYHEKVVIPNAKRLTIQAFPNEAVWFDGSVPVTSWQRRGSAWVSAGWLASFDDSASYTRGSNAGGFVSTDYPLAAHPDQMFVDGKPLTQIAAGVLPGPGQFAVDTSAKTLTIGSDPAGHEVRASDLQQALVVGGQATLRGFGVRRYATSLPDMGTLYFGGQLGGSLVQNVVVDQNATDGIGIATANVHLDRVTATNNGMVGIQANMADGLVVQDSVIDGNNNQHFNTAPSAAGIKVTRTRGVTISNNEVTNNLAGGIWTDESVVGFAIVGNIVVNNDPTGIQTELSDSGIVANNTISGSHYGYTVFNTGSVQIFNNLFAGNSVWDVGLTQDARREANASLGGHDPRQPIPDPSCTWTLHDITVSNNVFAPRAAGMFQFYVLDKETKVAASQMGITLKGNAFSPRAVTAEPTMVGWGGADNHTVNRYETPAALSAALGPAWRNTLVSGTHPVAVQDPSVAVPLPAAVAAAIGAPAGTRRIGPL